MYYESANIEIIQNTRESIKRSFDLVESARDEVLRIFSSITAFRRQVRVGVLHLFKESIEHGVKVRVLIPADYQQIAEIINEVNLVLFRMALDSDSASASGRSTGISQDHVSDIFDAIEEFIFFPWC
jgi:hypothetical protein